ncbi:hypothetical protein B0H12DRAFT_1243659 [Mycena haematopus]|nr:hypothetical protein B0H12DRAFT_1243659 [Mycena haematopus]
MVPSPEPEDRIDVPATTGTGTGSAEYFQVLSPDASYPSPYIFDLLGFSLTISFIRPTIITDFEALRTKAQFARGTRKTPLGSLVRTFYAMERIIVALGLDPADSKSSRSFTLDSDQMIEFSVEDILHSFKWTSHSTFNSKRLLYKSAKSVALRTWKDSIETANDSVATEMHRIYRGIKFLWADEGPLALPNGTPLPSPEAQGDEKCAANLKQNGLEKNIKSLLDKCTEE